MPTYVYKNIETGELYEIKQSMRDESLTRHPETGAAIKRVLSTPGIAFRGSGFYVTDSRPRNNETGANATKGNATKTSETKASAPKGEGGGGKGSGGE